MMIIVRNTDAEHGPYPLDIRPDELISYTNKFYFTTFVSFFSVESNSRFGGHRHFVLDTPPGFKLRDRRGVQIGETELAPFVESSLIVPRQVLSNSWTLRSVILGSPYGEDFPMLMSAHDLISSSSYPDTPLDDDENIKISSQDYFKLLPYHAVNSVKYCLYKAEESDWDSVRVWEFLNVVANLTENLKIEQLADIAHRIKLCRDTIDFSLPSEGFAEFLRAEICNLNKNGY